MKKTCYRILALALVAIAMMSFTACGKKEAVTAKHFKTFMEEKGLAVTDETEKAENDDFQNVSVAADLEKYSFEYYFMRNDSTAKNVYSLLVNNINKHYDGQNGVSHSEVNLPSSSDFSFTASDYYLRVIRVDNAVLYVTSYPDYKDECKKIIKELGY